MSTARTRITIAIAATFTAEPIEGALRFWLSELGFDGNVEHAPYNQVFQQLLDPTSVLSRNTEGVNLLLLRFEDWLRLVAHDSIAIHDEAALIRARFDELVAALRAYAARVATPTWIWLGPAHPETSDTRAAERKARHRSLAEAVNGHGALAVIEPSALDRYAVRQVFDPRRDAIGHIPYSDPYFTALATMVARRIHASKTTPIKVIAIDCDNTLWQGVVGEEGVHGIRLPKGKLALQRALIAQQQQGVVLCLLSKNVEDDVLDVLDQRADMLLKRENLVGYRINWLPKSANIASLANELDLGLDSFVFLDDNPVECAEMRAALPQVVTLQVPEDHELPAFIEHLWVFDRLQVTEEDRQRTRMYQENAQRTRLEQQASSIAEFLSGLELVVDIAEPTKDDLARVAQLTQRTNQLNFTTRRRSEAEIAQLASQGLRCLRVNVKDRFGDYGLVGVVIHCVGEGVLRVDSFMLSCRVLGRGVEHAMVAHLGAVAQREGASTLELPFSPSKKNQPAHDFLQSMRDAQIEARGADTVYRISASAAEQLEYEPGADTESQLELARAGGKKASSYGELLFDRSRLVQQAATAWRDPATLAEVIARAATSSRPELEVPFVAPVTQLHEELASMWASLLHVDRVGIRDDFAALGGSSLIAAAMLAQIDERHGVKLPMTVTLEDDTIEKLARRIVSRGEVDRASMLKKLRVGPEVHRHLFLVHDGDGETLLYMNLARRLPADVAVYGIEPDGTPRTPIRQTRIADMAQEYLQELRRVQPHGPYAVGGMCAGGVIAFEMALQLEAAGEQVEFVALLDSAAPRARKKPHLMARRRLGSFMGAVRGVRSQASDPRASDARQARVDARSSASPDASVSARLEQAAQKLQNVVRYEITRSTRHISDLARFRLFREVMDRGLPVPRWLERLSVRTVYDIAGAEYQPRAKLNGKAVLFRATRGEGLDEPFVQLFEDPLLGWPRWLSPGVSVEDVPGGHGSMLQEPHVQVMAERMTEELKALCSRSARCKTRDSARTISKGTMQGEPR